MQYSNSLFWIAKQEQRPCTVRTSQPSNNQHNHMQARA